MNIPQKTCCVLHALSLSYDIYSKFKATNMSKTNLGRRKLRFVAETISARRGRCALYALVRVPGIDLMVAIGARGIERKAEFGFVPNSESLVTHRLYHTRYIARYIHVTTESEKRLKNEVRSEE